MLALLVQARHQDASAMSNAEIRDELVTMLAAGHETTAHTLSWAVERLRRHPDVLRRLVEEADEGGKALREATIREVQRTRPVIAFAGRYARKPFELGGYRLPVDTRLLCAACLTHYDPDLFPHPDRFDPDRFLGVVPDTYSWIPFGGGIRRCIGATFAHMEMDVVLRVLLERVELLPTNARRAVGLPRHRLGSGTGRPSSRAPARPRTRAHRPAGLSSPAASAPARRRCAPRKVSTRSERTSGSAHASSCLMGRRSGPYRSWAFR